MAGPTVQFRTGIEDRVEHARAWLTKALEQGARVRVWGPPTELAALDRALWAAQPESFLAHVYLRDGQPQGPGLHVSPVWLGEGGQPQPPLRLLLNLGLAQWPDQAEQTVRAFERVVELVGVAPSEAAAGRKRWAQYKAWGMAPEHLVRAT